MKSENILNVTELLILQELMNIAFGSASADLEEVLDISIDLKVPAAEMVPVTKLKKYIQESMALNNKSSMVEEKFWGDFNGSAILVFPGEIQKNIISLLSAHDYPSTDMEHIDGMDQGVLLEIGNILIGACIGKISELLNTVVTYSPPNIGSGSSSDLEFFIDKFEKESSAIILKMEFAFHQKHLNGKIMIITSYNSINWLKSSLKHFMDSYE